MPVYKDEKRGTWYVSTYVEYRDGTKKRVMKRGFKTKREATQYENELQYQSRMNSSDNPLFGDVLDDYQAMYKKTRKESTVNKMNGIIRLYIRPFFGKKRIQDINNKDISRFHLFLLEKLATSTSKAVHKDLSAILNYAVRMEYINSNPAREVGNIKANENRKVDYWTLEEFQTFLKVVECPKYRALFMLLFYSGARIGELLALTWKDVDFKNNTININKRYYRTTINTPKNESSIRVIKIPQHTMNQLAKLKLKNKPKLYYVIFGEYERPHNQSSVNQRFYKYLDEFIVDGKQTLKRIRLHDFRHSHATYLINKNVDIQIISKRLGHSKTSTTYDIYSHLYPNKEEEAISIMEEDFKPTKHVKFNN